MFIKSELVLMLNTVIFMAALLSEAALWLLKINITGTSRVPHMQEMFRVAIGQLWSHTNCTSRHAFSRKQHFLLQIGAQLHSSSFPNRELLFALVGQFKSTISLHSKYAYSARCRGGAAIYSRSLFPGGTCDQMDHTALMEAKRGASWVSWHSCSFTQ